MPRGLSSRPTNDSTPPNVPGAIAWRSPLTVSRPGSCPIARPSDGEQSPFRKIGHGADTDALVRGPRENRSRNRRQCALDLCGMVSDVRRQDASANVPPAFDEGGAATRRDSTPQTPWLQHTTLPPCLPARWPIFVAQTATNAVLSHENGAVSSAVRGSATTDRNDRNLAPLHDLASLQPPAAASHARHAGRHAASTP